MENTDKSARNNPEHSEGSNFGARAEDFYLRYSREIWVVLAVALVVVGGYFAWNSSHQKSVAESNKKLGMVYVMLGENRLPEAEHALRVFLAQDPSGLARDKAELFLGRLYYTEQKYDQALEAYGQVSKGGKSDALIYSGALHGRAACYMQKKDYAQAVKVLDDLLGRYMLRTGDPKEDRADAEVVDLSPTVPNALWKQALCYRELKQPEKVRATVEKLRKAYPDSPEARDGDKLLVLMGANS